MINLGFQAFFTYLKRRINDGKNKQKCKNLVIIRLKMDINLFFYKIFLVFFMFNIFCTALLSLLWSI